jgi:hypothetical protein
VLFLAGLALSLLLTPPLGGTLSRLSDLRLPYLWLAPLAFLLQLLVVYLPTPALAPLAIPLIVGSHAALLLVALLNLRTPGMRYAAVGLALNLAVIAANGGLMPIAPETVRIAGREAWKIGDGSPGTRVAQSKDIIRAREDTWLEPLADRFWTGLPGRLGVIFSVGDVVLLAGVCTLVLRTTTAGPAHSLQLAKQEAT